jgi:hypothetical protein
MLAKKIRSVMSSILALTLLFSLLMPTMAWGAAAIQLKDITDSYAQKEIQGLVDSGIISGYEDGSFQPHKTMSRAELAKIIVLSLGLKENSEKAANFTDVAKNTWYAGFVGALVESGITQGTTATTFSPEAKVTREELVVFFIRAFGLEEKAVQLPVETAFTDFKEISAWAQAAVSLAFKIGFVNGLDTKEGSLRFGPKENAERQALARLAYEFKTNKPTYINKADKPITEDPVLTVSAVGVINATTVELTFNQAVSSVNKANFTFDNNLIVSNAELKSGSTTVVVLTTSLQSANTIYKVSYKGKDTGITITGYSGGGSGGSSSGSNRNNLSNAGTLINQGGTYTDLTLSAGGEYGPASGTTTITGTLTLNPGPEGQIVLQNVIANQIEVLSGSPSSIKLKNTKITVLKVNANNQTNPVRIESLDGAQVVTTNVYSQAILESSAGTLGDITLSSGTSNQIIILRGNIDGNVTVAAAGAEIKLEAPTGSQAGQTTIAKLTLTAKAKIKLDPGTYLNVLSITSPNTEADISGAGAVRSVTVDAAAVGSTLTIGDSSNIQNIQINGNVTLAGDAAKIAAIVIRVGVGAKVTASNDLKIAIIILAIKAIDAIGVISAYSVEKDNLILVADTAAQSAISLGVVETEITNYSVLIAAKQAIAPLKAIVLADLQNAKAGLTIQFTADDSATNVTGNVGLPLIGSNGTTVIWATSNSSVISKEGITTRPAVGQADAVVTLTAAIFKNGLNVIKDFKLTVKAQGNTSATTTGSITGSVVGFNGDVIAGAAVTLKGTTISAISDASGVFTLVEVPTGINYSIVASTGGYTASMEDTISVSAGTTTTLAKPIMFYTWIVGTARLAIDSSYKYTLAETDTLTGDVDSDKKMFIPLIVKDAEGKTLTSEEIAGSAYKFQITATGGLLLESSYVVFNPNKGTPFSTAIVQAGPHIGKLAISGVSMKGQATIDIQMIDNPEIKAKLVTSIGEKRQADKLAFSKAPNPHMVDNTDNEFKIKVYDQYGEEFKADSYRVEMELQANTITLLTDYGLTVKSNDVANPNALIGSPAATMKKFQLAPTRSIRKALTTIYNEATNSYQPYEYFSNREIFDKSFKFFTKYADPGSYTLKVKLNGLINDQYMEIHALNTTVDVLDPNYSDNKLNYEIFIDKGVDNTLLAAKDYLGGVIDATYIREYYMKFTKEIKVRAKTANGDNVSVPNSITDLSSSNPNVIGIAGVHGVTGVTYNRYISGLEAGSAKLAVTYTDLAGKSQTADLNIITKNEAPKVTSLRFDKIVNTISRNRIQALIASSKLYVWDEQLGSKLTAVDQFGDEFISDRAPETRRDDNGNAITEQSIQLYKSNLKLSYSASDIVSFNGGRVTIDSSGKITSLDVSVTSFILNVKSPSGIISSIYVRVN